MLHQNVRLLVGAERERVLLLILHVTLSSLNNYHHQEEFPHTVKMNYFHVCMCVHNKNELCVHFLHGQVVCVFVHYGYLLNHFSNVYKKRGWRRPLSLKMNYFHML